ncbi:MAG TPA: 2-succinyl-6-hydroxy-2,4-cyclohexadiene-1-carboxylate synthase [Stenomitos sp.]
MNTVRLEAGDLMWRIRTWGHPMRPAIVFLHGFTWDGAAWAPVAEALSDRFYCVAPDLPGHGATSWPEPTAEWSFDRVVDALLAVLVKLNLVAPHVVGYSMGGRLALRLALRHAIPMERLVLIGASAGLEHPHDRSDRVRSDAELAQRLVSEGMEAFLDRWMALPLFETMRSLDPALLAKLNAGRANQHPGGLAASLATMGTGSQPYLLEALSGLPMPTMLVVGEHDQKFRAIAEQMYARLPQGRLEVLPGCGHSIPFERPEALSALLTTFFTEAPLATSLT